MADNSKHKHPRRKCHFDKKVSCLWGCL